MIKKIGFSLLALLFFLFAFFQWNDPDSLKWILYYLLIGGLCFGSAFDVIRPVYIYMMIGVTLIWLAILLPDAISWWKDGMPTLVEEMKASSPYIELVREFLGLGISLISLVILYFATRK